MTTAVAKTTGRQVEIQADKVMVQMDNKGLARRIDSNVVLDKNNGTLVKIGAEKGPNDTWTNIFVPSAQGTRGVATQSGIVTAMADTVVVDGKRQPNGYRSPDGTIYYRCQAGGYSALGTKCVSDRTVSYNVMKYNLQDLLAKAKKGAAFVKMLPKGISSSKRQAMIDEGWGSYPLDDAFELWCDGGSKEFAEMRGAMLHREIHADRTCQTFAERNACVAHPAYPPGLKFKTTTAVVKCKMWVTQEGGIGWDGSTIKIDDKNAQVVTGHDDLTTQAAEDEATKRQIDAAAAAEKDEPGDHDAAEALEPEGEDDLPYDDPPESNKTATPREQAQTATAGNDPQRNELIKNIEKLKESNPISFKKACSFVKINPAEWQQASVAKLLDILAMLKAAIDNVGKQ